MSAIYIAQNSLFKENFQTITIWPKMTDLPYLFIVNMRIGLLLTSFDLIHL